MLFVTERIIGLGGPPSLLTEQSHQGCIQFSGFGSGIQASSDPLQTLMNALIGSSTTEFFCFFFFLVPNHN